MSGASATVLVTGAAGHLGRAVASAFAAQGASLVLVDRSQQHLDTAFSGGPRLLTVAADLLDAAQCAGAVIAATDRFGGVDVLCHLAGGFRMGEAVHEISDANWDFLFDINARMLVRIAHAVVPQMIARGSGKIVTVGAAAAQRGVAQMGAYVASKSATIRLTEAMSAELREHGINVNGVLPTTLDTPDNRAAMPDADTSRWVAPAALADVIAFLASDAARALHGTLLPV